MGEKAKLAQEFFSQGFNCAQSVALAFADDLGIERAVMARQANGFGGGMGWSDNICGTASAIALVLSTKYGKERAEDVDRQVHTYATIQKALGEWKEQMGGKKNCTELLGYNLTTPEGREAAGDAGAFHPTCDRYVGIAADIAEKYLTEA